METCPIHPGEIFKAGGKCKQCVAYEKALARKADKARQQKAKDSAKVQEKNLGGFLDNMNQEKDERKEKQERKREGKKGKQPKQDAKFAKWGTSSSPTSTRSTQR